MNTSFPLRVAFPIGSQPEIMPARTHEASLPYTLAATHTGTEPGLNSVSSICYGLLSMAILN